MSKRAISLGFVFAYRRKSWFSASKERSSCAGVLASPKEGVQGVSRLI